MTRMNFDCSDIRRAGLVFNCCSSCHDDDDNGYSDLSMSQPEDRPGRKSTFWEPRMCAYHCCRVDSDLLTRDFFAKMARNRRLTTV